MQSAAGRIPVSADFSVFPEFQKSLLDIIKQKQKITMAIKSGDYKIDISQDEFKRLLLESLNGQYDVDFVKACTQQDKERLSKINGEKVIVAGPNGVIGEAPDNAFGWLAIISRLTVALSAALDVDKRTQNYREAAKMFTMLRHKARSAYQTFVFEMSREEFAQTTRSLCEHYSELVMRYPNTTEKAFNEDRNKIKTGDYEPDFSGIEQEKALLAKAKEIKGQGVPPEICIKTDE